MNREQRETELLEYYILWNFKNIIRLKYLERLIVLYTYSQKVTKLQTV